MSCNDDLKFCSECKVWYNPDIPISWSTAHVCPSKRHSEILDRLNKMEVRLAIVSKALTEILESNCKDL